METSRSSRNGAVHSVDRAISVLQVLARGGPETVTDIAAQLGLHKSTVFRLLATLEARGLVEQNTTRGRYRLGYGVVQLAAGAAKKHDLSVVSRPVCQRLAETVGETVNIAVPDGIHVVAIDQVIGPASVTSVNWVGERTPMHASAAGKVFLADLTEDDVRRRLATELERFTPRTIVDPEVMIQRLIEVVHLGYGVTLDEYEPGLAALAAPIRALEGRVIAAVAISGPTFRINAETIPGLAEHVVAAADEISERNGFPKRG